MRRRTDKHLAQPNSKLAELVARTPAGMAYWSGTGPRGKLCGECIFFVEIKWGAGKATRCEKYKQMCGAYGAKALPAETWSCKYFKPR